MNATRAFAHLSDADIKLAVRYAVATRAKNALSQLAAEAARRGFKVDTSDIGF